VLGLVDALGRERFAVVGHDWGAVLAWHLAARNPERVQRAVALNGPHPATMRAHTLRNPVQALRSWYVAFFQLPLLPELALRAADFGILRSGMAETARPGAFSEEDFSRYRSAWAQPGALTAMLNWYRALPGCAGSIRTGLIRVPVRVIWGDHDAALDRGLAEAGLRLCEQGEAFHLAEASHWVQHDEPEQVNRLLIEFLAQ
jgi:pimeloyl-ACP methyl ester carboxylesterase